MSSFIDELGKRYGRWIVIKRVENNKYKYARWLCRCDCGNEKEILGILLRRGSSRGCGCLRRELAKQTYVVDRIGQRYSKLIVIRQVKSVKGRTQWLCKCDCGKFTVVAARSLQYKKTRSCGCLRGEIRLLPGSDAAFNHLVSAMKCSAEKRGLEWGLTKEEIKALSSQPCYYCGIEPSQVVKGSRLNGNYVYNGLDRLDNNKGYISSNVVASCKHCNYSKRARSIDEFKSWIQRIYKHFAC